MTSYRKSIWDPGLLLGSPHLVPLLPSLEPISTSLDWPDLHAYQHYLDASEVPICNAQSHVLKVVSQDNKQPDFTDRYAARIFLRGEIQTREQNWHDFFQLITWHAFPNTKKTINARHYNAAKQRFDAEGNSGRRSDTENLLSLFDECGAVVVSDDASLLNLIRNFNWKMLFYERRQELVKHLQCVVFGHAMLEKMFDPYIGITANAVLLHVNEDYFALSSAHKLQQLDILISNRINAIDGPESLLKPRDLSPLPLLGLPSYWGGNDKAKFYDNRDYFRPGRRVEFFRW